MRLNNLLKQKSIIIYQGRSKNLKFNKKMKNIAIANINKEKKAKKRINDFFIIRQIKFAYKTL